MDTNELHERYKHLMGLNGWQISSYASPDHVINLNDGPCGVRKAASLAFTEQTEIYQSVCLPSPSALACSFDERLCYRDGHLLAEDCKAKDVNVLLAPGVNLKRSCVNGRNFEYFSEDPILAGKLAAAYINGIEDSGVGACIKHYAVNSREYGRTIVSSELSERALNELYLKVFSVALSYSKPSVLMTSYNRVNGEYVNESNYLLARKLRGELNFRGLIISDWCAVSDKGKAIQAGLNIEMPIAERGVKSLDYEYFRNVFSENDLLARDCETDKVIKTLKKASKADYSPESVHEEAVAMAAETMVLVKNVDNALPLSKTKKLLVLGSSDNKCYFVGRGSAEVNPFKKVTMEDALKKQGIQYKYLEAYSKEALLTNEEELRKALSESDEVILLVGLYPNQEGEGLDRKDISLPEAENRLVGMLRDLRASFSSIVITGSVVGIQELYASSKAVLISYLAGEGQYEAMVKVLYGDVNPSGRLGETWIASLDMNPQYEARDDNLFYSYFDEDIFVGYRYYDLHKTSGFLLPFGYGLSYSSFSLTMFRAHIFKDGVSVKVSVRNDSDIQGSDVIQFYTSKEDSSIYRPLQELVSFLKVSVGPHQTVTETVIIPLKDFSSFNQSDGTLCVEKGKYILKAAHSSRDIIEEKEIELPGEVFSENRNPVPLIRKQVPSKVDVNSPCSIFLNNGLLQKFASFSYPSFDASLFIATHRWMANSTLREMIYQSSLDYDAIEKLVDFLNSNIGTEQ